MAERVRRDFDPVYDQDIIALSDCAKSLRKLYAWEDKLRVLRWLTEKLLGKEYVIVKKEAVVR